MFILVCVFCFFFVLPFLLWFFLWLPEEVLTLLYFLHHENGDFSILMKNMYLELKHKTECLLELLANKQFGKYFGPPAFLTLCLLTVNLQHMTPSQFSFLSGDDSSATNCLGILHWGNCKQIDMKSQLVKFLGLRGLNFHFCSTVGAHLTGCMRLNGTCPLQLIRECSFLLPSIAPLQPDCSFANNLIVNVECSPELVVEAKFCCPIEVILIDFAHSQPQLISLNPSFESLLCFTVCLLYPLMSAQQRQFLFEQMLIKL